MLLMEPSLEMAQLAAITQCLPTLPKLQSLRLVDTVLHPRHIPDTLGKALPQMAQLRQLEISDTGMGDKGVEALATGLRTCKLTLTLALTLALTQGPRDWP